MNRTISFILILTGYIICLLDTYYWRKGRPHGKLLSAVIYASCRIIWSLSTASLIWMCSTGNGGFVNRFLSFRLWRPLSEINYSVYLTHAWIVWVFMGTRRAQIELNAFHLAHTFIYNILSSYIVGFLFSISFEMPMIRLLKMFKK